MPNLPDAIFIIDINKEAIAVQEAKKLMTKFSLVLLVAFARLNKLRTFLRPYLNYLRNFRIGFNSIYTELPIQKGTSVITRGC